MLLKTKLKSSESLAMFQTLALRSEERRVGKECM